MPADTVALGRSRRTTAGNRMRELLEKAHQQDEDELFAEVEDDEDFVAPQDQRDVFLDDFADTDDEVEVDEDEAERQFRREERRKAKGKTKATYNPLNQTAPRPKPPAAAPSTPAPTVASSSSTPALLDPTIDPSSMAPTTLVLALRKQRREAKRQHRSEARRSILRASTLRTEDDIAARERDEKENPQRKGRKALHEGGEVRGVRPMTQDELIAAALEEEERNKEDLRAWLRREEERRELRRVGRKVVRGPRWTWVSRTVGKVVEVVEPPAGEVANNLNTAEPQPATDSVRPDEVKLGPPPLPNTGLGDETIMHTGGLTTAAGPSQASAVVPHTPSVNPDVEDTATGQYARNYIMLSQVPGGLPAELNVVLGDHVSWDEVQYIPARNRPINRRPTLCPFTGKPAKYRHPRTLVPYAEVGGYKLIEALLAERYLWSEEGGRWFGGEGDVGADGVGDVEGWAEAVGGGWWGGSQLESGAEETHVEAPAEQGMENKRTGSTSDRGKGKRRKESHIGKSEVVEEAGLEHVLENEGEFKVERTTGKGRGRGRGRA